MPAAKTSASPGAPAAPPAGLFGVRPTLAAARRCWRFMCKISNERTFDTRGGQPAGSAKEIQVPSYFISHSITTGSGSAGRVLGVEAGKQASRWRAAPICAIDEGPGILHLA